MYISHIMSDKTLTLIFVGRDPISIPRENPSYDRILDLIRNGKYEQILAEADKIVGAGIKTHGRFSIKGNSVFVDGKDELPLALANRVIQLISHNLNTDPLLKFWDNVKANPSVESAKDLYGFLEANHFPITDDGCFVAYKAVSDEFKDLHTQTIDNKPGQIVEMARDQVNADRNQTCSSGLHVAAYQYASTFPTVARTVPLVEVKVNPRDVVSVPIDYNAQKMRCCRYEVIRVNRKRMTEKIYSGRTKKIEAKPASRSATSKIKRLSADQKTIRPDGRGAISIATSILERLGMKAGETIYLIVNTDRARNFRITNRKPKNTPFFIKEMKIGAASTRIFSNVLAACQIDGGEYYTIAFNNGELTVK